MILWLNCTTKTTFAIVERRFPPLFRLKALFGACLPVIHTIKSCSSWYCFGDSVKNAILLAELFPKIRNTVTVAFDWPRRFQNTVTNMLHIINRPVVNCSRQLSLLRACQWRVNVIKKIHHWFLNELMELHSLCDWIILQNERIN